MKYGKPITEKICKHLEDGLYRYQACKAVGIGFSTFRDWMNDPRKPEFSEAIKRAEEVRLENQEGIAVNAIFEAMSNGTWQAGAWWLERNLPGKYKQRIEQDNKGNIALDLDTARKKIEKKIKEKAASNGKH